MTVGRRYFWEAAHWLPYVPEQHKCRRLHGHNYAAEFIVEGNTDDRGFVIDFWELDDVVKPVVELIDHRCLNDIEGLENPTAEHIARWLFEHVSSNMPVAVTISEVRVWETKDCWAVYKDQG